MRTTQHAAYHPIYLVRHAQCASPGTLLGAADPPLTLEGRAESAALARRLSGKEIGRIVSSNLRRAAETAGIVASEIGLSVDIDPRLNEISYGLWDGLTWEEIESQFPEAAAKKLGDWFRFTPEGAEPFTAFFERVKQAWNSIRPDVAGPMAIVAHRTVNAVLLALSENPRLSIDDLGSSSGDRIYRFEQPHASYTIARTPTPQRQARG